MKSSRARSLWSCSTFRRNASFTHALTLSACPAATAAWLASTSSASTVADKRFLPVIHSWYIYPTFVALNYTVRDRRPLARPRRPGSAHGDDLFPVYRYLCDVLGCTVRSALPLRDPSVGNRYPPVSACARFLKGYLLLPLFIRLGGQPPSWCAECRCQA